MVISTKTFAVQNNPWPWWLNRSFWIYCASSSFEGKLDLAQSISFYCLELCEKQLLQAPNVDVVVGCLSRVDNLY